MHADLRESIRSALAAVAVKPLHLAAVGLLNTPGHQAGRTLDQQVYAMCGLKPEEITIVEGTAK